MLQHDSASAAGARPPGDDELLRAGDRVAQLLEEIRSMTGPPAWGRVEEVVQRLLELYGAGLGRVLRHAAAVEGEEGALAARLRDDELVSSLLLLHGLHPAPTDERVTRVVQELSGRLGLDLELLAIEADGTVRLRAQVDPRGCPSSAPTLARAIERTILEAAPEVTRVDVEGLATSPAPREPLVQLRAASPGGGAR
jgi:Fe-S cluster biogenesis protein NfuA